MGLKLEAVVSGRRTAAVRKESWSERLSAIVELDDASTVDGDVAKQFGAASENG